MKNSVIICVLFCISLMLVGCIGPGISDYAYDVGTDYELVRSSAHQISIRPQDGNNVTWPKIEPKVVEIAWNERYVAAKQLGLKRRSENDSYMIPDESITNYWILDTIEHVLYGEYDLSAFNQKMEELGLSNTLILKDVNSFR